MQGNLQYLNLLKSFLFFYGNYCFQFFKENLEQIVVYSSLKTTLKKLKTVNVENFKSYFC